MVKVRALTAIAHGLAMRQFGDVFEVTADEAASLIRAGAVEASEEVPEMATSKKAEAAERAVKHGRKGKD